MFIDSPRFPESISYGSRGGPQYHTVVKPLDSGANKRNANWVYPVHKYNAAFAIEDWVDLETVHKFFHVCEGRAHGFRYKDWGDFKSCSITGTPAFTDNILGTGDGTVGQTFQLYKKYILGSNTKARKIVKPVSATTSVGWNGIEKSQGSEWTVNTSTGIVTAVSSVPIGQTVTAGFEFDVPCYFASDIFSATLEEYQMGSAQVLIEEEKSE